MLRVYQFDNDEAEFETVGHIEDGEVVNGDKELIEELIAPYSLNDDEEEITEYLDGPFALADIVDGVEQSA